MLLPDGISVVWGKRWLTGQKLKKITGTDIFLFEMERLEKMGGSCFFLGSTENNLKKIKERAAEEYPNVEVQYFSPPFKEDFTTEDNVLMLNAINTFRPNVLFIGMTAPKQEKWAWLNFEKINVKHVCCIGAVFDFYARNKKRAPRWMINLGLEWLYRLIQEPGRMWHRYLIGNIRFVVYIIKEKLATLAH